MATVIEELVSRLGFQIDDKKLDTFNKKSQQLKSTLKKIAVVASAAAVGITAWISKVGIATDAQIKFADSVGVSFEALQELQFATEREGGSLQSLQSSLLALSQRAGEASRGLGEGVQVFGMLGVAVKDVNGNLKTSDMLLEDIAEQFQRFDRVQQIEFANKLGISPDLLLLLQKGRKNLQDLRTTVRGYGLVTEETARNSEQFQDSLADVRFTVRALFTNIAGGLLPIITDLSDKFREWFLQNKALIKQNITKSVKALTFVITALVKNAKILLKILTSIVAIKVLTFLGSFAIATTTLITALIGLNANLTITNVLIGALPLLVGLAIAAIVVLVILIQDLKVTAEGGDSLFSRMAENSDKATKRIEFLVSIYKALGKAILVVDGIIDGFVESFKLMFDDMKALGDFVKNTLVSAFVKFQRVIDRIVNSITKLREGFNNIKGSIGNFFSNVGSFSGLKVPAAGNFQPQSNNVTNASTSVNASITVQSQTGDPVSIGEAVASAISNIARNGINSQPKVVLV